MPLRQLSRKPVALDGDSAVRVQGDIWATPWPVILAPSEPLAWKLKVTVAVKLFWLLRFAPAQNLDLPV